MSVVSASRVYRCALAACPRRAWVTALAGGWRVFAARATLYYWTAAILSLAASILCGQSAVWPRFICRENARCSSLARTCKESTTCERDACKFCTIIHFCLVPLLKGKYYELFHFKAWLRISLFWPANCGQNEERRL